MSPQRRGFRTPNNSTKAVATASFKKSSLIDASHIVPADGTVATRSQAVSSAIPALGVANSRIYLITCVLKSGFETATKHTKCNMKRFAARKQALTSVVESGVLFYLSL